MNAQVELLNQIKNQLITRNQSGQTLFLCIIYREVKPDGSSLHEDVGLFTHTNALKFGASPDKNPKDMSEAWWNCYSYKPRLAFLDWLIEQYDR